MYNKTIRWFWNTSSFCRHHCENEEQLGELSADCHQQITATDLDNWKGKFNQSINQELYFNNY